MTEICWIFLVLSENLRDDTKNGCKGGYSRRGICLFYVPTYQGEINNFDRPFCKVPSLAPMIGA